MRHISQALVLAGAAFIVTLVVLLPARLDATAPDSSTPIPKLVIDGCQIQVRLLGRELTGAAVELSPKTAVNVELVLTNSTDRSITIQPTVVFSTSKFTSPLSRLPAIPSEAWRAKPQIALAPGETKTVTLDRAIELPEGTMGSIMLAHDSQFVNALRVQTPPPAQVKRDLTALIK